MDLPPIDTNDPRVHQLLAWALVIYVGARLFEWVCKQALVSVIGSLGLLRRTWRQEMERNVKQIAQATATLADPANPNAELPPSQRADMQKIASGDAPP